MHIFTKNISRKININTENHERQKEKRALSLFKNRLLLELNEKEIFSLKNFYGKNSYLFGLFIYFESKR